MHFSGLGGISLSEEYTKSTNIERLEKRIEHLRLAINVLTIMVSLFSIYAIFQMRYDDYLLPLVGGGWYYPYLFASSH